MDEKTIIINPLLCYITSALKSKSSEYIISSSLPFFNRDSINEAKNILYKYGNDKATRRRGRDAAKAELSDIIEMIHELQEQNVNLPTFVSDSFDAMPPTSGYEAIADVMNSLIDELTSLRNEIEVIKNADRRDQLLLDSNSAIRDDILELKDNVRNIKSKIFENQIRRLSIENACSPRTMINSPRPSFSRIPIISTNQKEDFNNTSECPISPLLPDDVSVGENYMPTAPPLSQASNLSFADKVKLFQPLSPQKNLGTNNDNNTQAIMTKHDSKKPEISYNKEDSDGFIQVVKKKQRRREIRGTKRNENDNIKFKSAIHMYDLFIGNCDTDVNPSDLSEYILNESGIEVKNCIIMNKGLYSNSFKITISEQQRNKLLVADFWPSGIIVKKFYTRRNNINNNIRL